MKTFIERDGTHPNDKERLSFFYILWENEKLREMVDEIYDFKNRVILDEILENPKLSSSAKALITLSFAVYNNYPADISSIFSQLDDTNTEIALKAIALRYETL